MAGEVRGKVYEAITKVALEKAIKRNRKGWKILWHEQPDWISIEADLVIGESKDAVESMVMVTHSTSEGYSQKKFWRNFGELCQWKTQGPKAINCFSVLFNASVKKGILDIESSVVDGVIHVPSTEYGSVIINFVARNQKKFGASDLSREEYTNRLIAVTDAVYEPEFAGAFSLFAQDLHQMLRGHKSELNLAWAILRDIHGQPAITPVARTTYVRNGIAKLLIADPDLRERIYNAIDGNGELPDGPIPSYALTLGLLSEGLVAAEVQDEEITSAINTLGRSDCERIIERTPERMQDFIMPLRAADNIDVYSQFVVNHFAELITTGGMKDLLLGCFDDPVEILPKGADLAVEPRDVWLFVYCMTLEKALKGKIVGYGLSNLAAETGYPEIGAGGFVIPPFVHREKLIPVDMLEAISNVFAQKIRSIGKSKLGSSGFKSEMKKMLIQRQRYILSTYRNFDPLGWLIEEKLKDAGLVTKCVTVPSFLKERAGASSATSVFQKVGSHVLIYSQSVTEAGRIHKTKELSARFRATKLKWDGKSFDLRASAHRMYFVADGEWRTADLEMFLRSGIDRIFFADEMQELVEAIKCDCKK